MHRGGNGMACLIKPQSLSIFTRRSFLPSCSSRVFNMPLILDQCTPGFCVLSSVDSLCISMISSFKTHSRGLPGFLFWFIELKLSDLRFKDYSLSLSLLRVETRFSAYYIWDFRCFEMCRALIRLQ